MPAEQLTEQTTRHSVYTQRFAGRLANLFDPYIDRLTRELKLIMMDAPDTTQNVRRINQLVTEWRRASLVIYGEYNDDVLFEELQPFAINESEWELDSLKSVVKSPSVTLVVPAPVQVWAAVNSTPLIFPDSNGVKLLEPFIKGWEKGQIDAVGNIIRTGFMTGRTSQQIVQDIAGKNGYLDKQNRASIKTMVRTATNQISNVARRETLDENDDIVIGYQIIATLDSRTSVICQHHDHGRVFNKGLIIWADGTREKTKARPMPAFHPNCVLSGTIVTTCSDVDKLYKRAYKGTIVDIVTKSGRKLSITPNHPILTRTGWKEAKLVNSSDQLATITEEVLISEDYKNSVKAEVSDLFSAANISAEPSLVTDRPTTAEHFHGDGTDGEVSVIDVDSFTWKGVKSIFNKKVVNDRLHSGKFIHSSFNGFGFFNKRASSNLSTSSGIIGGLSKCASFFKRSIIHPCLLLLRSVSKGAELRNKETLNRTTRAVQAEVLGDSPDSYSEFVSFDDVLSVTVRELDSLHYVYNLENKDNWYLSNGIITHNCRSSIIAILDERFAIDESTATRASKGTDGGKQVSATETYFAWLKKQGNQGKKGLEFVQDVLGKERGDLLVNGGLTSERFSRLTIDELFRPIPLKELRKKQSLQLAFDSID
ncbi:MAG TPA: hypothetical protein EYN54_09235 [Methylococcaceae bacterium]|nr:hypothetical protein [Methylococcaceae bacterium]